MCANLYAHFPFCRRKCAYCALLSRAGTTPAVRDDYALAVAAAIRARPPEERLSTVYFGGGSPALCDLKPVLDALAPRLAEGAEFTVELHPLDVTDALLATLAAGGVNRVSMGVQSLDAATLAAMGRGYAPDDARRAFDAVRRRFENAGVDFIVGYPGDPCRGFDALGDWGLAHCSVYSLILEEKSALAHRLARVPDAAAAFPDDDTVMDRIREVAARLAAIGLERYEISNYALPGRACRHNLAVWRGEDYVGIGEGAFGRIGLARTEGRGAPNATPPFVTETTTVTVEEDARERALFRLRTREGLDTAHFPAWRRPLNGFAAEGLLTRDGETYRLTARGAEVCDSILAELV